jgi:hypothetical protein
MGCHARSSETEFAACRPDQNGMQTCNLKGDSVRPCFAQGFAGQALLGLGLFSNFILPFQGEKYNLDSFYPACWAGLCYSGPLGRKLNAYATEQITFSFKWGIFSFGPGLIACAVPMYIGTRPTTTLQPPPGFAGLPLYRGRVY